MHNVNETVTIDGLQSHFDLKVIFAFTQVVKEWVKNTKYESSVRQSSSDQSTDTQDQSLVWLISNIPDYTTFWNKSTRVRVGQMRLQSSDNVKRLILKLTLNFWRESQSVLAKHNIIEKFQQECTCVTYPIEVYTESKDLKIDQDKLKYVAEMSAYTSLREELIKDATSIPELVPLFYFALFVNQVMEESLS